MMTAEVGKHWMTQPQYSPGDPELDAGLHTTTEQRKKTGYQPGPNFPGGETKFGVAQNPNKSLVIVDTITYLQSKSFGRTNYWSIDGITNCNNHAPLVAIMLFDMNYLHGVGNARAILRSSGVVANPGATHAEQLAACEALWKESLNFVAGLNPSMQPGWRNRSNNRYGYVRSLSYPLS
jgi:hypothetical protein